MVSKLLLAALLGAAAAAPAKHTTTTSTTGKHSSTTSSKGHSSTTSATSTKSGNSGGQTPFTFPLSNGFPTPASSALAAIETQAHGTLPDGGLPKSLAAGDVTSFQLIAFNELFEVAFFSSLINNITNNFNNFAAQSPDVTANQLVDYLRVIQGQEELHAIGANAVLTSSGNTAIQPCKYVFPSSTLTQAVRLASTFTDVVLGALQAVEYGLAVNGDAELIPLVGGVIGQEGEQDGYYRSLLGLTPSAQPFLTATAPQFAYSLLNQLFIVPGSCPNAHIIDIPVFPPLAVTSSTPIAAQDQTLSFQFNNNGTNVNNLHLVYVNGQNTPIVQKLQGVTTKGKNVTFTASFPQQTDLLYGLTFAVLTNSAGPFDNVTDVAASTVYGPALIEVQ